MDLEKEISNLLKVMEECKVEKKGREVFELAKAYASDAKYFLQKGREKEALEAYAIAWAYIDALLHLNLARIPEKYLGLFTVERNS